MIEERTKINPAKRMDVYKTEYEKDHPLFSWLDKKDKKEIIYILLGFKNDMLIDIKQKTFINRASRELFRKLVTNAYLKKREEE